MEYIKSILSTFLRNTDWVSTDIFRIFETQVSRRTMYLYLYILLHFTEVQGLEWTVFEW